MRKWEVPGRITENEPAFPH